MNLTPYLEDIERRLDERQEEDILQSWKDYADGTLEGGLFNPPVRKPSSSALKWQDININDALKDEDLMVLSELKGISNILAGEGQRKTLTMRSNYGVGTIPSMFGAEPFIMPREMNTLPNVRSLPNPAESAKRIVESDFPDFDSGYAPNVFSTSEKFAKICEKYEKIGKFVRIDHPDFQGPFDICELIYGSDIFLDLYEEPELIHALLRKITDFYKICMEKWLQVVPNIDGYHAFFGRLHKGVLCLRDDSAMNLSPAFYEEFIYPYDAEILKHFGGGAVHFCGRGDHYIAKMSEMDYLYGIDLTQPSYNDMDFVFKNTIDKGINLFAAGGDYVDTLDTADKRYSKLFLNV